MLPNPNEAWLYQWYKAQYLVLLTKSQDFAWRSHIYTYISRFNITGRKGVFQSHLPQNDPLSAYVCLCNPTFTAIIVYESNVE